MPPTTSTAVFSPRSVFSRDFRAFRLLMMIYEDVLFTDELLEQVFALLPEFPADAHFQRGSFYNSVLEFYMRSRRFAEAEDVALRARYHYEQAHAPMLTFYIVLHQAIMRLMMGDAITARKHAAEAAQCLARVPFESPNDARLVTLLNACVEYEGGKAEPLARFLSLELDDFAHGEIWPSLHRVRAAIWQPGAVASISRRSPREASSIAGASTRSATGSSAR